MFHLGLEIYIEVEHEGGVMCVDYNCTKLCGFVLHNYTKQKTRSTRTTKAQLSIITCKKNPINKGIRHEIYPILGSKTVKNVKIGP